MAGNVIGQRAQRGEDLHVVLVVGTQLDAVLLADDERHLEDVDRAQAKAFAGSAKPGASHSIAAITVRLCSTGVTAGNANLPKLFSTEATRAIIEMNSKYGNVIRSMSVMSWAARLSSLSARWSFASGM